MVNSDDETVAFYMALMQEIKTRIEAINALMAGRSGLPPSIASETCYLQFRLICELIALACLVAHGDIPATAANTFRKEYDAAKILHQLEALHADFYPMPCENRTKPGDEVQTLFLFKEGEKNVLTKRELISLYGRTGNFLHRGTFRKLLAFLERQQVDPAEIAKWGQKIADLLSFHIISRLSGAPLVCMMENRTYDGQLTVNIYRPGPPLPENR